MRRLVLGAVVAATAVAAALPAAARSSGSAAPSRELLVLYAEGASTADARAAIKRAGGTVVRENPRVGLATVRTTSRSFVRGARGSRAIQAVVVNRHAVGRAPDLKAVRAAREKRDAVEREGRDVVRGGQTALGGEDDGEPLAGLQWDMRMIDATAETAHRHERGTKRTRVGIIDTGVDGSHPDIAPNFSTTLSRNFTTDIPVDANGAPIDGPCEEEPDASCSDPADVDENGHGTHVASSIGSPYNDLGIAGVAPNVTLVNLRAGQDSGYFFLQPTVDAITYAGDAGIDVVNMSFYTDPWAFNCVDNPADSPADRAEQLVIMESIDRALRYAHRKHVTMVASAGNEAIDYTRPSVDESSPDFASEPGEAPYARDIDPASCRSLPAEGRNVITTTAVGPSGRKAYYSSWGLGHADVAAPGGDVYDSPDNRILASSGTLAAYPRAVAEAEGTLNPDGTPNTPFVVRDCNGSTCAYYQYLQGTSMAAPHTAGVAALVVSHYGRRLGRRNIHADPHFVNRVVRRTATDQACPEGGFQTYERIRPPLGPGEPERPITETAGPCEGTAANNGFFGAGIIDADLAVSFRHR